MSRGRRVVQVMVDRALLRRRVLKSIVAYRAWPKAVLRVNASGYMFMIPISYQVVGEEDYAFQLAIDGNGDYQVTGGTYTSEPPRRGKLSTAQEEALAAAVKALGVPREHPMPEGGAAFEACLTVGEGGQAMVYSFWEGALEEDTKLRTLVRLLETL
jgi:hypothetical protein